MVWKEGHGTINSSVLEDAQGLLPLAITGAIEGVAAAIVASPNIPIMELGELETRICRLILIFVGTII